MGLTAAYALARAGIGCRAIRWMSVSVVTALGGVWLGSAAFAGYLFRELGVLKSLAFGAAALLMLLPNDVFPGVFWLELAGVAAGALLVLAEMRNRAWSPNAHSSRNV